MIIGLTAPGVNATVGQAEGGTTTDGLPIACRGGHIMRRALAAARSFPTCSTDKPEPNNGNFGEEAIVGPTY